MPNQRIATLIAERLQHSGLPHPGNREANQKPFTIPLPGLRRAGIPPEMAAQFAAEAGLPHTDTPKLVGEAIVNLLETDGAITLIDNDELAQLRQDAADAPDGVRVIKVYDRANRNEPLFHLTVGKTDSVTIDGRAILQALRVSV